MLRRHIRMFTPELVAATLLSCLSLACASSQPPEAKTPETPATASEPISRSEAVQAPSIMTVTAPTVDEVVAAIQPMVTALVPSVLRVVAISEPVEGWAAAAIDPPYREFPNVILFHLEAEGWKRVREGLGVGVQPYPSPFLDLHGVGVAMDARVTPPEVLLSEKSPPLVENGEKKGLVTVLYPHFVHTHAMGEQGYFLDRRPLVSAAKELYPQYESYREPSCIAYDYPPLNGLALSFDEGAMHLAVRTRSGQLWVYRWTGLDEKGLLTGGQMTAGWLEDRNEVTPEPRSEKARQCTSENTIALQSALALRGKQAVRCREIVPLKDPTASGEVSVVVQIDARGQVLHARVEDDSFRNQPLAQCVLANFLRPYMAGPEEGCTTVTSMVTLAPPIEDTPATAPLQNQ